MLFTQIRLETSRLRNANLPNVLQTEYYSAQGDFAKGHDYGGALYVKSPNVLRILDSSFVNNTAFKGSIYVKRFQGGSSFTENRQFYIYRE